MTAVANMDGEVRMRKVVVYLLLSLDGVAESPQTFIHEFDQEMLANLTEIISSQDTVLLGRRMYDEWAAFWPGSTIEPFAGFINNVQKYVATSSELTLPWHGTSVVPGPVAGFIRELKEQPGSDIGVHGSISLTRSLISNALVDELRLVIAPAIAGTGRRAFDGPAPGKLELLRSSRTSSGALLADYRTTTNR